MNLEDLRRRAALLAVAKRIPYEEALLELVGIDRARFSESAEQGSEPRAPRRLELIPKEEE